MIEEHPTEPSAELPWDRSTEKTLRELTALQRAILDSANYAIISCDVNGLIRTFNASATRMLGYVAEEVVGKTTLITLHDRMEVMVRAKELGRELAMPVQPGHEVLFVKPRMGKVDENEWTYIRKDGSRFPLLLSVTALRDDLGSIIGYLGVGRDLTDHKEIDRMKSEFISTVSHELRTPLTSIRGALGLLEGGVVGPASSSSTCRTSTRPSSSPRPSRASAASPIRRGSSSRGRSRCAASCAETGIA